MLTTTTSSRSLVALLTGRLITGRVSRGFATLVVAAVALIMVAAPASAHVGIASASTTDAVTTINFSFDHGCGSSPTVALEMQLPEGAQVVSTELMEGWVFDGTSGDGASTSQQVARISGPAIPDGQLATFSIVARGYDTSVDHLVPTVQVCEQGQEAWIDPDQASAQAAPLLTATTTEPPADLNDETTTTSTVAPGAGSGTADPQAPAEVTSTADLEADNAALAADEADATSSTLGIIIAAAIAAAVVAGIVMVVRSRRNTNG
jgi:uncharacterized protein YcnI